jgi:hypothetical protein
MTRLLWTARQRVRLLILHAVAWVRRMCDYDHVTVALLAACVALAVLGVRWFAE